MATRSDVYRDAGQVIRDLRTGVRSEEDLTPRDRLLRAIGRRQIRIEDLNDDGIDTIGLDRSLSERVARAVSALPAILPKHLTETRAPQVSLQHDVLEQPQRAATEPGLVENLAAQVAPGTPLPAMVRGPERLMNVAFSPLAAAARALEGIVEQVPRVAGYEPASTPVSRVVGNLADIAGVALPFMKRPPKPYDAAKVTTPSTGGVREPSIVREPLALPPAPPHTGAIEGTQGPGLNFTMLRPERQTRSQLPEGPPAPRALNAAAPDAADFAVEPARIRTPRERALPASDIVPPPALTGEPLGAGPKKLPAPELRAERVPTAHEAPASPLLEPRAAGPGHGFRGERPAIPAKGELAVDRPPRTRTYEGAPAAVEGAPPRPGDGATVASRMELPEGSVMLLDREGRPIVDQRGRPIVMPPSTPDAPPTTLRTAGDIATEKTGGPVPRRAPVETAAAPDAAAPPAPPDVPPSPPVGRVSTPPKTSPP